MDDENEKLLYELDIEVARLKGQVRSLEIAVPAIFVIGSLGWFLLLWMILNR